MGEISPQIPDNVVKEFNKKFKKKTELTKPEITNIINKTDVFDISDGDRKIMVDELNTNIIGSNNSMVKKYVDETNRLEKFRKVFYTLNHRDPTNEEIKQNHKYIKEDSESSNTDGNETDNTDDLENGKTDSGLSNFTDDNLLSGENEEQNEIVDLDTTNEETFL